MSSFMGGGSSSLGGSGGMKPNTGFGGSQASTGTLKRGGMAGDKIPKGYRAGQLQQFTPEQMDLLQQMIGHLGPDSWLSKLASGDESQFEEMEAPAHRQFQGQLGQLASKFSQGGTGGRKGSGFQNTTTAAASNFAQDLASKRHELTSKALNDLMGFSNTMLQQRPQERFLSEKPQKQSSGWGGIAGAGIGATGGFFAGGPAGALTGAKLGYDVGSSF
jgi:hypothetical protein